MFKLKKIKTRRKGACMMLITILNCMFLLTSCSKEEGELPLEPTKENTWYWGYFNGFINGTKISLKNERPVNKPINSSRLGVQEFEGSAGFVYNSLSTFIAYDPCSILNISLYDLIPSERYVTLSFEENLKDNSVCAIVYANPSKKLNEKKAVYVISKEHPFRVEILDVMWASNSEPIIEVELDGVLYNRENPNDVLIIKGVYGAR